MSETDDLVCWKCGASLTGQPRPLSRYQPCRQCGADLYVCRMCVHYDSRWNNACREERAEPPTSKEKANFCDWFTPRAGAYQGESSANEVARSALDALFGGAAEAPTSSGASALKDLFKPAKKD